MITFGNGIAFSRNFDRTERESRETHSLKFTCRGDVPFHLAKLLGRPLSHSSELLWRYQVLTCLAMPVLPAIAGW